MKINKIIVSALALMTIAACSKEKSLFENKVFIAADNFKNEVRVAVDEDIQTLSRTVKVAVAQPVDKDIEVSFVENPSLLDQYRKAYYDEKAELLPSKHYDIAGLKTLIAKGKIEGTPVSFDFINLGKENLDYEKSYVLPVSIECNDIKVLERSKTMYFVIKKASMVNLVADMNTNCAWPEWESFNKVSEMEQCTMEALVNCHSFNNKSEVHTLMGIEDHFLIRIGDTQLDKNQLHLAVGYRDVEGNSMYRKSVTSDALKLKKDRWYHVAVTFNKGEVKIYLDGKLRAQQSVNPIAQRPLPGGGQEDVEFTKLNFKVKHSDESDGKPRCFWVGYSYDSDRSLDGMLSEVRVWDKVLTEAEINSENHFYKLYDPEKDANLIAYWKFCEGNGTVVKDYSQYGHDLQADHDLVWYPVDLPANNN